VSVVLPFFGDPDRAREAVAVLTALDTREGDELLLADNTPDGVVTTVGPPRSVTIVDAGAVRSAYSARNLAARAAASDWLLFIDGDVRPVPDLLDRYFDPPPAAGAGAVAGQVHGARDQPGMVPRYVRSRGFLRQDLNVRHPHAPMAVTANLLVRRAAFDAVDGFVEGARSGADADFCWRLQQKGFELELRERAAVEHWHRDTLRALLRQVSRDGAGLAWLEERHPGSSPKPRTVHRLARSGGGALAWAVRGKGEAAVFKLIDGAVAVAESVGYRRSNGYPEAARRPPGQSTSVR
jgi:GT2 family glycosyltransferase